MNRSNARRGDLEIAPDPIFYHFLKTPKTPTKSDAFPFTFYSKSKNEELSSLNLE